MAILGTSRNGLGDRWHIAAGMVKKTAKICRLWHIRQSPLPPVGISRTSQRDMPAVGPTIAHIATVGKLQ
jgi:hypothetical protein